MESLRLSRPRRILILLLSSVLSGQALFWASNYFFIHRNLFSPNPNFEDPPGQGIESPLFLSLPIAGGLVSGLVCLWIVLSARRRGLDARHALAAVGACLPFALAMFFTDRVLTQVWRELDWVLAAMIMTVPLVTVSLAYLPLLRRPLASQAYTGRNVSVRLGKNDRTHIVVLAIASMLAWLASALYLEHGWDGEEGFGSAVRHLAGANLPLLPALAALGLLFLMTMNRRGQRVLHGILAFLETIAVVATVILAFWSVTHPDALIVVPVLLALHAYWAWLLLRLLGPLYDLRTDWLSPRSVLED